MEPAARVMDMSELRTAAGASVALCPCDFASKPTASIAASTSGLPTIWGSDLQATTATFMGCPIFSAFFSAAAMIRRASVS